MVKRYKQNQIPNQGLLESVAIFSLQEDQNGELAYWEDVEELLDKIIDSVTNHWHENNVYGDLREWLGLTKEEYVEYVLKIRKQ